MLWNYCIDNFVFGNYLYLCVWKLLITLCLGTIYFIPLCLGTTDIDKFVFENYLCLCALELLIELLMPLWFGTSLIKGHNYYLNEIPCLSTSAASVGLLLIARHLVLPSGNLQISKVRMEDSGMYRCTAVNPLTGQRHLSPTTVMLKVTGEWLVMTLLSHCFDL